MLHCPTQAGVSAKKKDTGQRGSDGCCLAQACVCKKPLFPLIRVGSFYGTSLIRLLS